MRFLPIALALLLGAPAVAGAADAVTLVVCAPGYPGTTAEAKPAMDAFASALADAAGWPRGSLAAEYQETEKGGLARLAQRDAALAIVPLPFLLQDGAALKLAPRLQVQAQGGELRESWSLVARKGRVASPAALAGFTVVSIAGYAPAFVRGALGAWGRIPEGARVIQSGQVLSALRRAASGEDVALFLDRAQAAALATLPFAADLEVVARSPALPAAFLCTVGSRLPASRLGVLERALEKLPSDPAGAAALEGLRLVRFAPLDAEGLAAARRLASGAAR